MGLPLAVSVVIVIEHDARFLLIEEDRGGDLGPVWYFPSGALEPGETLAEAARREVLEETGYEISPVSIIAVDHGAFSNPSDLFWWRFVVSAMLAPGSQEAVEEPEILQVAWCALEEFDTLNLRTGDAAQLCSLHHNDPGLSLDSCRLAVDGTLEGFFA